MTKSDERMECPYCDDRFGSDREMCPHCYGDGRIECKVCEGSEHGCGNCEKGEFECGQCGGTGYVYVGQLHCEYCEGKGYIDDEELEAVREFVRVKGLLKDRYGTIRPKNVADWWQNLTPNPSPNMERGVKNKR